MGKANVIVGAVVAAVLVVAVGVFVGMQLREDDPQRLWAVVHDGDGNTTALALSVDQEQTFATSLGENTVVVEDGFVYVREADCDNQDCVHQGKLGAPGRQIICLPHKLWIEVVADGDAGAREMDVDSVAEGVDVVAR